MSPATISELERGVRRATVDDLTAIAAALAASPIALLMPHSDYADAPKTEMTGAPLSTPAELLKWLLGLRQEPQAFDIGIRGSWPPWAWAWEIDTSTTI